MIERLWNLDEILNYVYETGNESFSVKLKRPFSGSRMETLAYVSAVVRR